MQKRTKCEGKTVSGYSANLTAQFLHLKNTTLMLRAVQTNKKNLKIKPRFGVISFKKQKQQKKCKKWGDLKPFRISINNLTLWIKDPKCK